MTFPERDARIAPVSRPALEADTSRPAGPRSEFAVELRQASKTFGQVVALDGVSLAIRRGEFFSLLGPSGCGKTTTLNLIGGFETASRGTILIDGRPMGHAPAHTRPVNTVFQSYALFPHMSVAENVGFGLRMKGVPREARRRAIGDMLRLVSLEAFEERRPSQLSGGQRLREQRRGLGVLATRDGRRDAVARPAAAGRALTAVVR